MKLTAQSTRSIAVWLERQQRQRAEREAQVAREQLQQSEAENERQAHAAREAQIKADQVKREQADREAKVQKQQNIELRSTKGIDYRELEKLLKVQEWRKADELTAKLMLKVANREKENWLDTEHLEAFPCEDLQTIDQLWVHYSNSKFGFSIQQRLWLECGGEIGKDDYEGWTKFGVKVGWYHPENNEWRTYTEFINDTENAQNALPASLPSMIYGVEEGERNDIWGFGWGLWGRRLGVFDDDWSFFISSLSQKLLDCNR